MESFDVLRKTIKATGVKTVASEMNLSTSAVYKWCEANDGSGSGSENPLDRVLKICNVTKDNRPISWLCQHVGGFFVKNPMGTRAKVMPVLRVTQVILQEFSEVLNAVSNSFEDGQINESEAKRIRAEWEKLKEATESFVFSCEQGVYKTENSALE